MKRQRWRTWFHWSIRYGYRMMMPHTLCNVFPKLLPLVCVLDWLTDWMFFFFKFTAIALSHQFNPNTESSGYDLTKASFELPNFVSFIKWVCSLGKKGANDFNQLKLKKKSESEDLLNVNVSNSIISCTNDMCIFPYRFLVRLRVYVCLLKENIFNRFDWAAPELNPSELNNVLVFHQIDRL